MGTTYHHYISLDPDERSRHMNIRLKQPFLDQRKLSKLIEVDANEHGGLELGVLGIVPSVEFTQIETISNIVLVAGYKSAQV